MTVPIVPADAQAQTDPFVVRAVIVILGIVALVGMVLIGVLVWRALPTVLDDPEKGTSLIAILAVIGGPTGLAITATSTLLASTRSRA